MTWKKVAKYAVYAIANATAATVLASVYAVHKNTVPQKQKAELIPELTNYQVDDVEMIAEDGIAISAWLIENNSEKVVVLLAGRGHNRSESLIKAQLYLAQGFSVLMPDLRGTGSSEGRRISFGWNEQKDLIAWYYYLRTKGYSKIAAHGFSLGAATICYTLDEINDYYFVALESCHPELKKVVKNGLKKLHWPALTSYLMMPVSSRLASYKAKEMQPVKYLQHYKGPLFILGGDSEILVPKEDTILLAVRNNAKYTKMHLFKGAEHLNFSEHCTHQFKKVLNDFLETVTALETEEIKKPTKRRDPRVL